ncbi:hypothetical protein [Sphingomonas sp. RS2018]
MLVRLHGFVAALLLLLPLPAWAEVRMTFWSHDTSNYFPHAFVTLKGKIDATGEPVDTSYGFTLNGLSPAALFKSVPAHIDFTAKSYIRRSNAHFTVVLNDAHYMAIKALAEEWGAPGSKWNLNRRNCVHFVAEAARRAGLTVVENRKLMKKPKSFTRSLIPLNQGRIAVVEMNGKAYWAANPDEELFGVPEKVGGSVLDRRVRGIDKVAEKPDPTS